MLHHGYFPVAKGTFEGILHGRDVCSCWSQMLRLWCHSGRCCRCSNLYYKFSHDQSELRYRQFSPTVKVLLFLGFIKCWTFRCLFETYWQITQGLSHSSFAHPFASRSSSRNLWIPSPPYLRLSAPLFIPQNSLRHVKLQDLHFAALLIENQAFIKLNDTLI